MKIAKLHPQFQLALLRLLRRQDPARQMDELAALAGTLSDAAVSPEARDYWDVAADCIVAAGRMSDTGERKRFLLLLKEVEHTLGRWAAEGDEGLFGEIAALSQQSSMRDLLATRARHEGEPGEPSESVAAEDALEDGLGEAGNVAEGDAVEAADGLSDDGPIPDMDALASTMAKMAAHSAWGAVTDDAVGDVDEADASVATLQVGPDECAPIDHLLPRLRWVVRQACRDLDRLCELELVGSGTIPRVVIKALVPTLECLTRNGVFLGAKEPPEPPPPPPPPPESGAEPAEQTPITPPPPPQPSRLVLRHADVGGRAGLVMETDALQVDLDALGGQARAEGLLATAEPLTAEGFGSLLLNPAFFPSDRARQVAGYGSGLADAAAAVEEMGGRLTVQTEPGGGLQFRLMLPAWNLTSAPPDAAAPKPAAPKPEASTSG